MSLLIAFVLCTAVFWTLLALRRQNDERGEDTSNLMRSLQVVAGIGYFGFGMWLLGEIAFALP
jgi:preprotein translocase subunit YajC